MGICYMIQGTKTRALYHLDGGMREMGGRF